MAPSGQYHLVSPPCLALRSELVTINSYKQQTTVQRFMKSGKARTWIVAFRRDYSVFSRDVLGKNEFQGYSQELLWVLNTPRAAERALDFEQM